MPAIQPWADIMVIHRAFRVQALRVRISLKYPCLQSNWISMMTTTNIRKQRCRREATFLETVKDLLHNLSMEVAQIKRSVQELQAMGVAYPCYFPDGADYLTAGTQGAVNCASANCQCDLVLSCLNPEAQIFVPTIQRHMLLKHRTSSLTEPVPHEILGLKTVAAEPCSGSPAISEVEDMPSSDLESDEAAGFLAPAGFSWSLVGLNWRSCPDSFWEPLYEKFYTGGPVQDDSDNESDSMNPEILRIVHFYRELTMTIQQPDFEHAMASMLQAADVTAAWEPFSAADDEAGEPSGSTDDVTAQQIHDCIDATLIQLRTVPMFSTASAQKVNDIVEMFKSSHPLESNARYPLAYANSIMKRLGVCLRHLCTHPAAQ